ncbi:MAG: polyhydroxyalkanoate depolymerase [Rhizobiaceae bacterium]
MMPPFAFGAYEVSESARLTTKWLGTTARTFWGNPLFHMIPGTLPSIFSAWGEVTEHAIDRLWARPDWGIEAVVSDGRDYLVDICTVHERPFCRLIQFHVERPKKNRPRVLLVAPMSGHYATLLRSTVTSLLPNCDIWVTDWRNARNVSADAGTFDIEDYCDYLLDFLRELGPDTHLVAVCQPAPLALAVTAWLAQNEPEAKPLSLTLMGGPVDPAAGPTQVSEFAGKVTVGQLKSTVIQTVGAGNPGVGRKVYPGSLQLASFMAMNWNRHSSAYSEQIFRTARGESSDLDRHNSFYDEYLAVMDLTAEFYLSTVERIFQNRELANNSFTLQGEPVDLGAITDVPVKIVEGERDDIAGPGQCAAAHDLLTGLPKSKKRTHLQEGVGHYGIFSGTSWHRDIRPLVYDFLIDHQPKTKRKAAA